MEQCEREREGRKRLLGNDEFLNHSVVVVVLYPSEQPRKGELIKNWIRQH